MVDKDETSRLETYIYATMSVFVAVVAIGFMAWMAHKRHVEHKWYEEHDAEIRANRVAYYRYLAKHTRNFSTTYESDGRSNVRKGLLTSPAYRWHPANIHHRH